MDEIERYIKERRISIGNSIKSKKKIYLDTNYWILLQNQSRESDNSKRILLNTVIELSQSGKCIFPISEVTFWEVLKQADIITRKETIGIIDFLSNGISLIARREIIQLELMRFARKFDSGELYENHELVWDRIAFLGMPIPQSSISIDMFKRLLDFLEERTLTELINIAYQDAQLPIFTFKDNVELLNKWKRENINRPHSEVFKEDVREFVKEYIGIYNIVMVYLYTKKTGKTPTSEEINSVDVNPWINIVTHLVLNNKVNTDLSSLTVIPRLFAIHLRNKTQIFKDGNDTMDYMHASFALPFCDCFFTEKRLKSQIQKGKLDEMYSCIVESSEEKVIEILNLL